MCARRCNEKEQRQTLFMAWLVAATAAMIVIIMIIASFSRHISYHIISYTHTHTRASELAPMHIHSTYTPVAHSCSIELAWCGPHCTKAVYENNKRKMNKPNANTKKEEKKIHIIMKEKRKKAATHQKKNAHTRKNTQQQHTSSQWKESDLNPMEDWILCLHWTRPSQ